MWFKALSFLLGSAFLIKGLIASLMPERFYAVRRTQYASETIPAKVLIASGCVALAFAAVWYATLFHYVRRGWIVTGLISAIFVMSVAQLLRWPRHRAKMSALLAQPQMLRGIDATLIVIGIGLLLLGFCVF